MIAQVPGTTVTPRTDIETSLTPVATRASLDVWMGKAAALARLGFDLGSQTATMACRVPGPFLAGQPLNAAIPQVRSCLPLGFPMFNAALATMCTEAARSTINGVAAFWLLSYPVFYVATNDARRRVIAESHIGSVDAATAERLSILSCNNRVMRTFLAFSSRDSTIYSEQRNHLKLRFHWNAKDRLAEIVEYANDFMDAHEGQIINVREFITALVLRTSSRLIDVTDWPLDNLLPKYKNAIARSAKYGICGMGDAVFEDELYSLFMEVLQHNFAHIQASRSDVNLIRNIIETRCGEFPETLAAFEALPEALRYEVAMNFVSVGLGAKVHSTVNTFDWALARLLRDEPRLAALTKLVRAPKDDDFAKLLVNESTFNTAGAFASLASWINHNVTLNPPFGHQFFLLSKERPVVLQDGTEVVLPADSFVLVNYVECNRSDPHLQKESKLASLLKENNTLDDMVRGQHVASFGGSVQNDSNHHTRTCPAARTSLLEQDVVLSLLLRKFDVVADGVELDEDPNLHPLLSRMSVGDIVLEPRRD